MRFIFKQLGLLTAYLMLTNTVLAEPLQETVSTYEAISIPLANKNRATNIQMPVRGDTIESVEFEFGPPISKQNPKGSPPISRWDYPSFAVYFESNSVIHSALKN
ncbi:MAG: hypothetical protein V7785_04875 [Bermanella sp.]